MTLGIGARGLLAVGALLGVFAAAPAVARDRPGDFDFYVLSLSWSPSYCAGEGDDADPMQCAATARPYAFVVHGLWPQYEKRGWPQFCQKPPPFVAESIVRSMLDIMPGRKLVLHQWRKHGTCSGLDSATYFEKVRLAQSRVTIPDEFRKLDDYRMVSPSEVADAFRAANPGLGADMISVQCSDKRLSEVRVCMSRTFQFTACPEVAAKACTTDRVAMPPMRGG
ncbi:ribonuclease T2 [Ancylobacter sp. SL191]|uniref:ribonuclease T2 n=1 Tax=Ancylobacter sp. SL191 TaxID=2995166 RepID=UPI00226FB5D9|nr:ribonuclease T2 [Ancylobacter sp. SL191]WAC25692.1 ribonuclease T2 [Ancylobacter sp. SL191]